MVTTEQIRAAEKLRRQLETIERREERAIAAAKTRANEQLLAALDGVDGEVLRILQVERPTDEVEELIK